MAVTLKLPSALAATLEAILRNPVPRAAALPEAKKDPEPKK